MNFLVVLTSADLIFISRYVCINFLHRKNQLLPLAILRAILSLSQKCVRQMQTYLVRKSKNVCFIIFHPFLDNFVQSREFYSWRILSSLETFIQCRKFCSAQLSLETFIQYGFFYLVWRLLSSMKTFIQCGDFYLAWRLLSSAENFIQYGDFYPVWKLLSSEETFIQCRKFYSAQ